MDGNSKPNVFDEAFRAELTRYGPHGTSTTEPTLNESQQYCRRLARRHYENFTVASFLLPKHLRQHFCNVYAYCRWADDLADETGDPSRSLELLAWWESLLNDCFVGPDGCFVGPDGGNHAVQPRHPVFVALAETVRRFHIPIDPFRNLLIAFRQDQRVIRYETFDALLDYCRHSANPVGQIVLYLGRCHTPDRVALSDSICTGLQLANFWQDVARDWDRGRVYLPREDCRRHGYECSSFERREASGAFRHLLAEQVDRAEKFLRDGLPLVAAVPKDLRLDISLFIQGGLAILDAIRRCEFDVWSSRPTVSKRTKFVLLAKSWWWLWRTGA